MLGGKCSDTDNKEFEYSYCDNSHEFKAFVGTLNKESHEEYCSDLSNIINSTNVMVYKNKYISY